MFYSFFKYYVKVCTYLNTNWYNRSVSCKIEYIIKKSKKCWLCSKEYFIWWIKNNNLDLVYFYI